jgi:hypothetical protein
LTVGVNKWKADGMDGTGVRKCSTHVWRCRLIIQAGGFCPAVYRATPLYNFICNRNARWSPSLISDEDIGESESYIELSRQSLRSFRWMCAGVGPCHNSGT